MTDTASDKNRECARAGDRQHGGGPVRRHGRVRDDRAVGDQREVGRPRPPLHLRRRRASCSSSSWCWRGWLVLIPMGALVAVMFMVSIGTFDWSSLRTLHVVPRGEAAVMLVTVATVVADARPGAGRGRGGDPERADVRAQDRAATPGGGRAERGRAGAHLPRTRAALLRDGARLPGGASTTRRRWSAWCSTSPTRMSGTTRRWPRSTRWCCASGGAAWRCEMVGLNEASATILLDRLAVHDKPGALEMAPGH